MSVPDQPERSVQSRAEEGNTRNEGWTDTRVHDDIILIAIKLSHHALLMASTQMMIDSQPQGF